MRRREFLANAAKAVPIAGVFAASAALRPEESDGAIGLPWLQPADPGMVRFQITFDPAEVLPIREPEEIVDVAFREAERFFAALAVNPAGLRVVPGSHFYCFYEWLAESFTRAPEPESKIPHRRAPLRAGRFLLTQILAEDLCRYVWHRQGRIFCLDAVTAIGAFVDRVCPCPKYYEPEAPEPEPMLEGKQLERLRAAIRERYHKAPNAAPAV